MQTWSAEHLAALAATALGATVLVAGARSRGEEWAVRAARALAVVIFAAYAGEHAAYALRGWWTPRLNLPLHLTDAVTLTAVAALWRPDVRVLAELVYFWALTASLQAVLTPDLGQTFPDVLFLTYFATHSGAVAAACLLAFGLRRAPRPGAVRRAYGVTLAFTLAAGAGTVLTGGNYMYLRHKPSHPSLLDVMGPWPVYIAAGAVVGLLLFLALAALAPKARADPARGAGAPGTGRGDAR